MKVELRDYALVVGAVCLGACSEAEVTVEVGSIPSALGSAKASTSRVDDAIPSTNEYAFAKVDGIKLELRALDALTGGHGEVRMLEWSGGREIEIAPGSSNTIAITDTATVPYGTYAGAKIRYANSYKVKAFCRTQTKFVYTTASEVRAIDLAEVGDAMPADYDYFAYPFAEVTTAQSADGGNPETMGQTEYRFSIDESSTTRMALLFDPSYLVTCYDGTTNTGSENINALSPFLWGNNNGLETQDFFPDDRPNFGMGYMPVFVWLSTDPNEELPTAETYASSVLADALSGDAIDFGSVSITSFAFRADGSLLDARTRISMGNQQSSLQQFFSDFSVAESSYSFMNGEWTCDEGYSNCRAIQDRQVIGFQRTSDYESLTESMLDNGPDCGQTIVDPAHPEWGNRAKECLPLPEAMTWRRLIR